MFRQGQAQFRLLQMHRALVGHPTIIFSPERCVGAPRDIPPWCRAPEDVFNKQKQKFPQVQKDLTYFKSTMDSLRKLSPTAKSFIFVHKMDLVPQGRRDAFFAEYKQTLSMLLAGLGLRTAEPGEELFGHIM